MKARGTAQLIGDNGNPTGSGLTKIVLEDMTPEDYTSQQTKINVFIAAITTAQLTGCNKGDVTTAQKSESLATKPDLGINIDRQLVVTWRKKNDSSVHRLTIPGVPASSTGISLTDAGERINNVGRAALEGALNSAYGLTVETDGAVVLTGKVIQKR